MTPRAQIDSEEERAPKRAKDREYQRRRRAERSEA